MDMNRIGALIRYDWMLHKHNIKLTYAVIAIIYVCIALLYFISKFTLSFEDNPDSLPIYIAGFCATFFNYAGIAITLLMTTLVTEKFCHPRTATAYLTLPGNSLEKFCVVAIDFIAAFVALKVLYLIMFYITMGVCYLNAPSLDWSINGFAIMFPEEASNMAISIVDQIKGTNTMKDLDMVRDMNNGIMSGFVDAIERMQNASFRMTPFSFIAGITFYLVLTMLFKTNAQIKAIGCLVLTYIAYMVGLMIFIFGMIGRIAFQANNLHGAEADELVINSIFGPMTGFLDAVTYFIYASPFLAAALLYIFYRQICRKQAK